MAVRGALELLVKTVWTALLAPMVVSVDAPEAVRHEVVLHAVLTEPTVMLGCVAIETTPFAAWAAVCSWTPYVPVAIAGMLKVPDPAPTPFDRIPPTMLPEMKPVMVAVGLKMTL